MVKKILKTILGISCLILGFICLFLGWQQFSKYQKGNAEYEKLQELTIIDPSAPEDEFELDWAALQAENPDIVGWIRMAPTVNYPVVHTTNNSFYLKHGFNKKYNINGCIFMNTDCSPDWTDKNTIVYGHNMNNGSMFGNNDYYKKPDYTKKHPVFYLYTPEGRYTYQIFDVMTVKDGTGPFKTGLEDEEMFEKYLQEMERISSYQTGVSVLPSDQIISLSTCTNHGRSRFVIQGVLSSYRAADGTEISVSELRNEKSP